MTNTSTTPVQDDDTQKVELPAHGRKTLTEQGKSFLDIVNHPEIDDAPDDAPDEETEEENTEPEESEPEVEAPETLVNDAPASQYPLREVVLENASEILNERERNYGPVEADLSRIAAILSVVYHQPVTVEQASLTLAAISMARLSANPNRPADWDKLTATGALGGQASNLPD